MKVARSTFGFRLKSRRLGRNTPPPIGSYRHQVRALASLARYVPVFIGVVLATAFTLSVMRDDPDTASQAWVVGSELLGLFGGFGLVALPFIFLATAALRRGRVKPIVEVSVEQRDLHLHSATHTLLVPRERIRSASAFAKKDRVEIGIELDGGLTDGDHLVLDLPEKQARGVIECVVGEAPEFDLTRTRYGLGIVLWGVSVLLGGALANALLSEIIESLARMPRLIPTAEHIDGWRFGLLVTASGVVNAILNAFVAPASIKVGVDGLRIRTPLRRRFVPYETIRSVSAHRGMLVVERIGKRSPIRVIAFGVASEILAAVARTAHERLGHRAPMGDLVPPSEPKAVRRWREALLGRADGVTYRSSPVSDEALADAVHALGVPASGRVAAAAVLASRGSEDDRERIRIAASSVADDATRTLIERIAEIEADEDTVDAIIASESARHATG
jgi:hypothetical protein